MAARSVLRAHVPGLDHAPVSDEPSLAWDDQSALILALMRLEAKLDRILELLEDELGEEEEEPDT